MSHELARNLSEEEQSNIEQLALARVMGEGRCVDCGTDKNVCMHNSREVRYGLFKLKVRTERSPGFLCQPCWMAANPVLFSDRVKRTVICPTN